MCEIWSSRLVFAFPSSARALLFLFVLAVAAPAAVPSAAQSGEGAANALFVEAVRDYRAAQSLEGAAQTDAWREVRRGLERILSEHPNSAVAGRLRSEAAPAGMELAALPVVEDPPDAADAPGLCIAAALARPPSQAIDVQVQIDAAGQVAGIPRLENLAIVDTTVRADFLTLTAAIDACAPFAETLRGQEIRVALAEDGTAAVDPAAAPASAEAIANAAPNTEALPPTLAPATEAEEAALDLDQQAVRDLQARLLILGFDPNGIDGLLGRGTRAALRDWQESINVAPTGYLNADQRAALATQSESALSAWRADPQNEQLYLPPPPFALGPSNVVGIWRFTSTCGSNSRLGDLRINGILNISHAGGNSYTGTARQSQGFRGQFAGQLNGRQMTARINWGLLIGRVEVTGRIADQELVMRGRDSNGCSFYAAKS